jgi:hypothetical protein
VLLASPLWNVRPPMIMRTFAERYDFSGKIVLPVTTYAVSGLGTAQTSTPTPAGARRSVARSPFVASASATPKTTSTPGSAAPPQVSRLSPSRDPPRQPHQDTGSSVGVDDPVHATR